MRRTWIWRIWRCAGGCLAVGLCLGLGLQAQARHPITVEDLMQAQRIADPQVSPDGRRVSYTQTTVDLAANRRTDHIWIVGMDGGDAHELIHQQSNRGRWSPDGRRIAFIGEHNGTPEVWIAAADGSGAHAVTTLATGADGVTWARRANRLVFTSAVYPACTDQATVAACNREKLEAAAHDPARARLITELLFRHWDAWRDGRYTHLFTVMADGSGLRDLTPGAVDAPTFFLDAPDGYDISPDGAETAVTSNHTGHPAWTTNNDIYLTAAAGGANADGRDITGANPGSDASPQYSPDGRYIAYTSQARNGYESDLFRLRVYNRASGAITDLTTGFDQWVEAFAWAPDSRTIYFLAPEGVENPVFRTRVDAPAVVKVLDGPNQELAVAPDGKSLIVTQSRVQHPTEVYRYGLDTRQLSALTHANDAWASHLELPAAEVVHTRGGLGANIESLLLKPPGFDPHRKYPGLVLIHGGPQSAWTDAWGYRWNPELFAARGYVVIMPNPHGSVGYGQAFVEEVSGDWGGAAYQDVMAATDQLANLPYVDRNRIGAAGASFGGYMINWIAGHTQRFKVLVSHDGVYDLRSMYGETEELWFPEWELKGLPWEHSELYDKWSPSRFVQNVSTPMLLIEGNRDYRVPEGQALQLFTALQRRGVPSKLLYMEQEGHWVNAPADSQLWYHTVLDWLDQHLQSR